MAQITLFVLHEAFPEDVEAVINLNAHEIFNVWPINYLCLWH